MTADVSFWSLYRFFSSKTMVLFINILNVDEFYSLRGIAERFKDEMQVKTVINVFMCKQIVNRIPIHLIKRYKWKREWKLTSFSSWRTHDRWETICQRQTLRIFQVSPKGTFRQPQNLLWLRVRHSGAVWKIRTFSIFCGTATVYCSLMRFCTVWMSLKWCLHGRFCIKIVRFFNLWYN